MLVQLGACLQTLVTTQIIGNDEDISAWVIYFDGFEQLNVALGIPRGSAMGDLLVSLPHFHGEMKYVYTCHERGKDEKSQKSFYI